MPRGIYVRTEVCNKAHSVRRSAQAKLSMKALRNRLEVIENHRRADATAETKSNRSKAAKIAQNKLEVKQKHKETYAKPEVRENKRQAMLRMHAEGKFPKQYTKPHKKLHEAMIAANLWDGFENEVTVGFWSIDICSVEKKIAIQVDGEY